MVASLGGWMWADPKVLWLYVAEPSFVDNHTERAAFLLIETVSRSIYAADHDATKIILMARNFVWLPFLLFWPPKVAVRQAPGLAFLRK
jgi:hypothetical protein